MGKNFARNPLYSNVWSLFSFITIWTTKLFNFNFLKTFIRAKRIGEAIKDRKIYRYVLPSSVQAQDPVKLSSSIITVRPSAIRPSAIRKSIISKLGPCLAVAWLAGSYFSGLLASIWLVANSHWISKQLIQLVFRLLLLLYTICFLVHWHIIYFISLKFSPPAFKTEKK